MAVTGRIRTYVAQTPIGWWSDYWYDGSYYAHSSRRLTKSSWRSEDTSGFLDFDNAFVLDKFEANFVPLNCISYYYGGPKAYQLENWPCLQDQTQLSHMVAADTSIEGATLTARMSPNKPAVDLPLFLFELRDLPGMLEHVNSFAKSLPKAIDLIKSAGDSLLARGSKGAANNFLQYQFGWAPLISDLQSMFSFGDAFKRRRKQLNSLWDKGLHRKIELDRKEQTNREENFSYYEQIGPFVCTGKNSFTTISRSWGTSRWKSTAPAPTSDKDKDWETTRSLLGLGLSPATLWQAIPWSFLVDYFVPIGDYLDTYRNSVPCGPVSVCVMRETITTVTRREVTAGGGINGKGSGGTGSATLTSKFRLPKSISPFPSAIPFLGGQQMSNLLALSVARRPSWK